MKTFNNTNSLKYFFLLIIAYLCSCSPGTRTVKINSLAPPLVTVPSAVKSVVILDRTQHKSKVADVIGGIITGELPGEDKAAVQVLITNLKYQLDLSPRFTTKIASERLIGNSHTLAFPDQLDWSKVVEFCKKYQTDALVSIEVFDTDFVVTDGKKQTQKKVKDANGVEKVILVDEFYAEGINTVKAGVRIYIPKTKTIVDQHLLKQKGNWRKTATSKLDALSQLINKSDANKNLSRVLGKSYARRIAPMNIVIKRSFRGKHRKCPALEKGSRYADVAKWNEAIEVWEKGLETADEKSAKFLSYNIAVVYEVLGDYENAQEWASKSYIEYGHNEAKTYLNQLNKRIENEKRANL